MILVKMPKLGEKMHPSQVVFLPRRCYRAKNGVKESTSMRLISFGRRAAFLVSVSAVLSACNTSNPTSVLGTAGKTNADLSPPATETITESELRAFCPGVELREGTAFFTKYEKGGAPTDTTEADKTKVIHQASLGEVTRSCSYAGESLTMTVAASGRLVPGPKAVAGQVNLPIRVAVTSGDSVIYSELTQFAVSVDPAAGAATFVFNKADVNLPKPTDRSYRVYVGFDEGPPKKPKPAG
jgi:hypothetical protein